MSDPSSTPPSAIVLHRAAAADHHHHHHTPPPLPPSSALARDYRKGNWTLHETLILITAKRLDDERRTATPRGHHCPTTGGGTPPRSAELRWKWVENYCWKNGCLRSQNQCNDKWDNLLRDYKKVRDYETRVSGASSGGPAYWAMEKHDRKERNLPSNLSAEVFEALTDVLTRRNAARPGGTAAASPISSRPPTPLPALPPPPPPPPPPQQQKQLPPSPLLPCSDTPPPPPLPPPPPPPPPQAPVNPSASAEASGSSEQAGGSEWSEASEAKRRRVRGVGSSVARGASMLARTLVACEERRDKRHRDLLAIEERRLRMEEDRTEMSRQGIAGLIAAVNGLSGAIHALVADHHRSGGGGR